MPIGAWAHAQFWRMDAGDGGGPPVAGASAEGGYVPWQATVIMGSIGGGCQAWWDHWVRVWRLAWRLHRLRDERAQVLERVLEIVEGDLYLHGRTAVRDVATTLGFNKPTAWGDLAHLLKSRPDLAENHWRHLYATMRLEAQGVTLSKPMLNLVAEVAFHGYALNPQRPEAWRLPSAI